MSQDKIEVVIDGQNTVCDVYFSFMCKETGKAYIGYTNHMLNEDGAEKIYVSSYDPKVGREVLGDIETQEEWDLINSVVEKIKKLV